MNYVIEGSGTLVNEAEEETPFNDLLSAEGV